MMDNIIIGLFVVIVIFLHVWLYRWVKFKVDEGTIITLFKNIGDESLSPTAIASQTNIKSKRVLMICNKSKDLRESDVDLWRYQPK
jgi:hypothetical protein